MSRVGAESRGGKSAARPALVRDAVAIVLAGVALGLAFNYIGLSSRPPRGLPWIARAIRLDSADSLAPAAPAPAHLAPAAPLPLAPAPPAPTRARAERKATPAGAARHGRPPASSAAPATASRSDPAPASATPNSEVGAEGAGPAGADPAADLPAIPEGDRPLRVSLATVSRFVKAGAALLVDAREARAFAEGHIPGAVSAPYEDVLRDPTPLGRLDPGGRPIIVYCSGGTCEPSLLLAAMLVRDFGQRRVLVYEGGFPEWAASGEPVSRDSR